MNNRRASSNSVAKWLPIGAAGGLVALVVGVGVLNAGSADEPDGVLPGTLPGTVETLDVAAPTTVFSGGVVEADTAADTIPKVPISGSLRDGSWGDEVKMVQQRLADLAFDPGPIDGQFGSLTTQAVWAFEKLVMDVPRAEATGVVTPELWDRMQDPITISPRRPTGGLADHTEIYLPQQVMIVFHRDEPAVVAHVSTGELKANATGFSPWYENAAEYRETITIDTDINGNPLEEPEQKAVIGWSYTPPGVFEANRKIEGVRNGPLGGMWDPIYINQGIAIHGAINVPLQPASHGCIRVNRPLGEKLQSMIELGDQVLIWDGETEPEDVSEEARKMRWDQPDPDATTTTTTTTTTVAPTTVAPTTVAATPTNPPTTTVAPTTTSTSSTTTTVAPTTTSSTTTTTVAAAGGDGTGTGTDADG